jgi:hypothetical protein
MLDAYRRTLAHFAESAQFRFGVAADVADSIREAT